MNSFDKARANFDQGMNCSQAVLSAFAEELGLDEDLAICLASTFGGGLSRSGAVCGAASGALMALGLKYGENTNTDPEAKAKAYAIGQEFLQRFRARNEAIDCKDLLGYDISTPEGHQAARQQNLFKTHCPLLVQSAAEIVSEML